MGIASTLHAQAVWYRIEPERLFGGCNPRALCRALWDQLRWLPLAVVPVKKKKQATPDVMVLTFSATRFLNPERRRDGWIRDEQPGKSHGRMGMICKHFRQST